MLLLVSSVNCTVLKVLNHGISIAKYMYRNVKEAYHLSPKKLIKTE